MKTIAVIRLSAMGDVAMTSPIVREVARAYPDIRMVMVVPPRYEAFFEGIPNLEFFPLDLKGRHKGFGGIFRLYADLKKSYKIDAVADLHGIFRNKVLRNLFRLTGTPVAHIHKGKSDKAKATRPQHKDLSQLRHTADRYADVFQKLGYAVKLSGSLPKKTLPVPCEIVDIVGEKHGRWIGIAPFAGHPGKMYPIVHVGSLIEMLEKDGDTKIFIFGGGKHEAEVAALLEHKFPSAVSVVGRCDLPGEIALISNLDVMVSMDSSAMHMASLVGTRAVSVWGATHPCTGFLGYGQSSDDIVSLDMPCRPCSVYGNKPCLRGDYACMNELEPKLIYKRINRVIP